MSEGMKDVQVVRVVINPRPAPAPPDPKSFGLGDLVEAIAKPFAKAMHLPCLDDKGQLKPESPCGKRKTALNKAVPNLLPGA